MVSAEQIKLARRYIKHAIDNDKRMVTYREIAREIECHVNIAKNLLLEYHQSSQVTPTYLLTGPLKSTSILTHTPLTSSNLSKTAGPSATQSLRDLAGNGMVRIVDMDEVSEGERNSEDGDGPENGMGNDEGDEEGGLGDVGTDVEGLRQEVESVKEEVNRWGVVLVQADGLDEKVALFEEGKMTICVYSIAPKPIIDPAQYLIPNLALRERKNYHNPTTYGTITGESLKASGSGSGAMKDGGMTFVKGKAEVGGKGKADVVVGDKGKAKAVEAEEGVTKVKGLEEKVVEKGDKAPTGETKELQKIDEKKIKPPTPTPPPPATTARSGNKKEPAKPRASQKSRKRIITSEDEDEDGQPGSSAPPPTIEPTSSARRADDDAAMEAMMDMGMDVDLDLNEDLEETQESLDGKKIEMPVVKKEPGVRKKRKVRITEMVQNAKGYTVSRDTWKEESYSGESEPEVHINGKGGQAVASKKSAPAAPSRKPSMDVDNKGSSGSIGSATGSSAKPAAKKVEAKKGGQSTLAGFFTKGKK